MKTLAKVVFMSSVFLPHNYLMRKSDPLNNQGLLHHRCYCMDIFCKNVKGYNKLFLTSSNALGVSGDSELDDELVGATKRKLLGAFKKNQSSKTTSRFLTNEFIKEIA